MGLCKCVCVNVKLGWVDFELWVIAWRDGGAGRQERVDVLTINVLLFMAACMCMLPYYWRGIIHQTADAIVRVGRKRTYNSGGM